MRFYSMKLLSLSVFLSAICVLAAAEDKVKGQLPAQFKKLGLRDDQVQKIYKIQTDYRGKGSDLEKQLKDLRTKEKTEVEAVLTDEQKNRLKEIRTGETADPKKTSKLLGLFEPSHMQFEADRTAAGGRPRSANRVPRPGAG